MLFRSKKPARQGLHRRVSAIGGECRTIMKFARQIVSLALLAVLSCISGTLSNALLATPQEANPKESSSANAPSASIPVALPKGKKLILKDGTFQIAREYKIEGDQVHYWSVERSAWEDIPAALIDWDATHKAEAEQTARDAELKAKIRASNLAERTKDIDIGNSLELRPGIFLPDGVGFYAFVDHKLVFEMKQSLAESKASTSREMEKILTGLPVIPSKVTLQIPGERAPFRINSVEPEFYMRPADAREPRFRLFRAQVKGGRRVLDSVSTYFSGKQGDKGTDVSFQAWTAASGVFRYTIEQRLEPGEYAFVELTDEGMSSYVWDFGIDPPGTKASK